MTSARRSFAGLDPAALYLGDNGRAFCGAHAGATAATTGRDLSGQQIHRVTEDDQALMVRDYGARIVCEVCRARSGR